jgi:serine/threonine protein kinase
VLTIANQIAEALEAAHERGIIHRDLKPANVALNRDGNAKVLAYMSPEQAKGRAADKRSDMWAFGCVVYEMLTGKRAFGGEDISDTLANVLKVEPEWNALPDGSTLTFAELPPFDMRLFTLSTDSAHTRKPFLPDLPARQSAFSPDGRWLAYA